MKDIKDKLNEGLFGSKIGVLKRLNKIEVKDKEWNALGVAGQSAMSLLLYSIDYIADNVEKFKDYKNTEEAIRDAINNVLHEDGHSKKLFLKDE